jgi:hypothetical protein
MAIAAVKITVAANQLKRPFWTPALLPCKPTVHYTLAMIARLALIAMAVLAALWIIHPTNSLKCVAGSAEALFSSCER